MPTTKHEIRLLIFLGDDYGKKLPKSDEDMFCLLIGIGIAKECCQMTYMLTKHRFEHFPPSAPIHDLIRHEEELRIKLYNEAYELVSCYIAGVKGFKRKGQKFHDWYKEMSKCYNENQDIYAKTIKEEADRIFNVVYAHLMRDLYNI